MKNAMLSVLCAAALMACNKNENTQTTSTTDSIMTIPTDTTMMMTDSTMTGTTNATLTEQDKMFANEAATGGMMEVMLGVLAETNSSQLEVKSLGKMMVDDHTKANDELKSCATSAC
jgi:putative membrane protein